MPVFAVQGELLESTFVSPSSYIIVLLMAKRSTLHLKEPAKEITIFHFLLFCFLLFVCLLRHRAPSNTLGAFLILCEQDYSTIEIINKPLLLSGTLNILTLP